MVSVGPNENLAREQFSDLNREFYASDPAYYFRARLDLLLLAAAKPDELDSLLAEGFNYGEITVRPDESQAENDNRVSLQSYISTEAEVLLHHAAEALLRLYLAHAREQPCPWLECAGLTSFALFKREVAKLKDGQIVPENISRVFLGRAYDASNGELKTHVDTMVKFLRLIAKRILDDSHLYNAAKHGLAVLSGPTSLIITDEQTGASFGGGGPSLRFLEIQTSSKKEQQWHQTTRWVDAEHTMAMIFAVITAISNLWSIARARYTGAEIQGVHVVTAEMVEKLAGSGGAKRNPFTRSSISLAYYLSLPRNVNLDSPGATTA